MARSMVEIEDGYKGPIFIVIHKDTEKLGTKKSFKNVDDAHDFIEHNDTTGDYIVVSGTILTMSEDEAKDEAIKTLKGRLQGVELTTLRLIYDNEFVWNDKEAIEWGNKASKKELIDEILELKLLGLEEVKTSEDLTTDDNWTTSIIKKWTK